MCFPGGGRLDGRNENERFNIADRMKLSSQEIALRKEFLEFGQSDIDMLRDIHAHIESLHVDDVFTDQFYRHLRSFPELLKFIPDEDTVNHLKEVQAQYFKRLTAGDYDDNYVADRLRVGYAHQRIGLEPKWYTGAYRKYLSFLLSSLCKLSGQDNENLRATYDALLKVVFFDMELALDTYFHGDRQELLHMANHDVLTGLPNRNLLSDRIEQALHQAHREQHHVAILFLDLDRFKNINDSLGHQVGDKVITSVSARLMKTLREGDTIARLGGDEFVAVVSAVEHEESIASIAEKLLLSIERPIMVDSKELYVSASIGIAVYPLDGENQDELLKNADTAMYRAKQEGNTFRFYQREMNHLALARLNLEARLRRAIENNEFLLHYQPQIDIASQRIVGVEALLRWKINDLMIPMADFIPLAEETGLIIPIGEWVLEEACRQAVAWRQVTATGFRVAVNLSARQIWVPDFEGLVYGQLKETGCKPEWLELEITESTIMERPHDAARTLMGLDMMGIKISIDDFGTGYSSLAYLKQFPIHALKVDRSFVGDISTDRDNASIVRAIIALAHGLGLEVVGEGVEDNLQLAFLKNLGCDVAQGFLFSKPLPADEITQMLLSPPDWASLNNRHRNESGDDISAEMEDDLLVSISNCRVRRLDHQKTMCLVNNESCSYLTPYGNFCEHPLSALLADDA